MSFMMFLLLWLVLILSQFLSHNLHVLVSLYDAATMCQNCLYSIFTLLVCKILSVNMYTTVVYYPTLLLQLGGEGGGEPG